MKEKTCRICGEQYNAYIDFCFRDGEKLDFNATSDNMLDDTLSDASMSASLSPELGEDDDSTETFSNEITGGVRLNSLDNSQKYIGDEEPTEIDIFEEDQPTIPDIPKSFEFAETDDVDESLEGPTLLDNTLLFSRADLASFEDEEDTFINSEPMPQATNIASPEIDAAEKLFGGPANSYNPPDPVTSANRVQQAKSNGVGLVIIGVSSALTAVAVVSLLFLWTSKNDVEEQSKEPMPSQENTVTMAPSNAGSDLGSKPNESTASSESQNEEQMANGTPNPSTQTPQLKPNVKRDWTVKFIEVTGDDQQQLKLTDNFDSLPEGVLDTAKYNSFNYLKRKNGEYQIRVSFRDGSISEGSIKVVDGKFDPAKIDFGDKNPAP